ncbi:1-aminocyclopropane-1-carboxylate deaminase/D-cysteine desulfhydrase [Frankia sp. R43]|uniref:1-aminocyclopropane-1-carboxylate deaminase/D-cysteine desulfhydrase n=1 Tax=Frankia sp. R43 TaxID=269536 RepID=UPI0009F88F67|nr:pyridoxal-phosphate dependent enzyme [Frankia sp. R43]
MNKSENLKLLLPSPLEELHDDRASHAELRIFLKRDDLINPEIPGNKWRKLKYNIAVARAEGHTKLLTFGGAYSNHLRAVAAAGYYFDFQTIGIVRGEEHLPLNPTLSYAQDHGMELHYLDRTSYRSKGSVEALRKLRGRFGDFYLIPEGGSNELGIRGCAELPAEITQPFDVICCSCGTGGTLAGVAAGLSAGRQALGFPVLKGGEFLTGEINRLQREAFGYDSGNWTLECGFHFGGFAKSNSHLADFIEDFRRRHTIVLEWVYEAKMMYGLFELIRRETFSPGTAIVAILNE